MNNNRNNNNNNNNNSNNNNRRRGRGNSRQNGGGGGPPVNRVDSRARGNAPQLLEKYRKLALDAHLNGDRVTEEYYLQFAEHYFRVLADSRVRQDEARLPRRDDRWGESHDGQSGDGEESFEYNDGYGEPRGQLPQPQPQIQHRDRDRDRAPRGEEPANVAGPPASTAPAGDRAAEPSPADTRAADARPADNRAADARAAETRSADPGMEAPREDTSVEAEEPRNPYEPAANPFVRDGRSGRTPRQRGPRREGARPSVDEGAPPSDQVELRRETAPSPPAGIESDAVEPARDFDPAVLPPSFTDSAARVADPDGKPKRRARRSLPRQGDAEETTPALI